MIGIGFSGFNPEHHVEGSSIKKQHARACKNAEVAHFPVYTFRHTRLTRWAAHMDPYTLAHLAGHSDFSTTLRDVHPQTSQVLASMEKARAAHRGHNLGHSPEGVASEVSIIPPAIN